MAAITLEKVHKTYPNGHVAVRDLDLEIADGEFVVLVGPSGCGKSTTLRMVAGLESPTGGQILIGGADVTGLPPQERDIAMVFQTYALYPHKTVRANLAFGLRMRGAPNDLIGERVAKAARALGLEQFLDRKPGQLSGGQRQRVALGRAIVREPKAFLFDDPLSNLDAKLRVQTRAELARMHRDLAATMLYVTHDQEEAMTLGDRVAVLNDGALQQVAAPMEIYRKPANVFVAGFIGSPAMNFLRCTPEAGSGGRLRCGPFARSLDAGIERARPVETVLLGIRPHDLELTAPDDADATARVDVIEPLGSELLVYLVLTSEGERVEITAVTAPDAPVAENATVGIVLKRDRLHLFDAGTGERIN